VLNPLFTLRQPFPRFVLYRDLMACSKRPTLKRYNSRATECSTGGGIDEEDIDILELTLSQAIAMMKTGEIQDGKTIMLLQHLRLQQLEGQG